MSRGFKQVVVPLTAISLCFSITQNFSSAQNSNQARLIPAPNVNMVSGTEWPEGDPFLQRQNEPSLAVSTRNPMHVFAGANDYRTVDIPGLQAGIETGDSWLGVFHSYNGGDTWGSTLLAGYPQDTSPEGIGSPLYGFRAAADPVVRAGTNGLFYYSGIAFDRGINPKSTVFVARFIDLNNEEGGSPIKYIGTVSVSQELTGEYFIDKPWMAVDVPRGGAEATDITVPGGDKTSLTQSFACGNVYIAWAEIGGDGLTLRSKIMFSRSTDCGATWSAPVQLSAPDTLNHGASIAVAPTSGEVYVAWRQFPVPTSNTCIPAPFQKFVSLKGQGYWKTHPDKWPAQSLTLGSVTYSKTQLIKILKTPVLGDATYILAGELIAAKLNYVLHPNASIVPTFDQADAWLRTHPLGSKPKDKSAGLALQETLAEFNQGAPLPACNPIDPANRIVAIRSDSMGLAFGQPGQVSDLYAFDQGTTNTSFRSTAYPTTTVDSDGRVYVAWSTRGQAAPSGNPDPVTGDSRIVIATSPGGTQWPAWTAAQPIDQPSKPGHQIKPSLCFSAGKLFLVYYDFREDLSQVFEQFVADLSTYSSRHTADVRAAIADPGETPIFTDYSILRSSDQLSRYPFLITGTSTADATSHQLQYNPPNLPLFVGGTAPFFGDYVDLAPSPQFVFDKGAWAFNTDPSGDSSLQVAWTDNRDVKGPPAPDYDWTRYIPPNAPDSSGSTRQSIYDPSQTVPACRPGTIDAQRTGMRNQNIYNTRVSRGLYVTAPGNSKPLGDIQRAFVAFVQNTTSDDKFFRLEIAPTADATASFTQFGDPQESLDVKIASYSSVSRTVFVTSQIPQASVRVNVVEIDVIGGSPVPGGLVSSVVLNPDPTNPPPADASLLDTEVYNPAIFNPAIFNPAIFNPAIFNPAILNPAIFNPAILNPAILNPAIFNPAIFNPAIFNPAILNPAILNPAIFNPAILNPAILNPAILNPAILNPAIYNGSLQEIDWVVQNQGNTTGAYTFNALLLDQPEGLTYQLLIYRLYETPVADGCSLKQEAQQELISSTLNPDLSASLFSSDAAKPTFFLSPGDHALVTLLVYPDPDAPGDPAENLANFNPMTVASGVVAQAVNSDAPLPPTGNPAPAAVQILPPPQILPPLEIVTTTLPGGAAGSPYNVSLAAAGGYGDRTWSLDQGSLPAGLTLGSDGVISGTPTEPGTFNFTVRITDFTQTVTQEVSLTVVLQNLIFVIQPSGAPAGQVISPAVQVYAQDNNGAALAGILMTLTIGSPGGGGSLSGASAITDASGTATFPSLSVSEGGNGYTVIASAGGFSATSAPFDIYGIAFENYPNGTVACNNCPVSNEFSGRGVEFAGSASPVLLDFAPQYGPVSMPTNHGVTASATGTLRMTFPGAPRGVRFEQRFTDTVADPASYMTGYDVGNNPIPGSQVTWTGVSTYTSGGGFGMRAGTTAITSMSGISRIDFNADLSNYLPIIDDVVIFLYGESTDPGGDVAPGDPDLVYSTATVRNGNLELSVRLASGSFEPLTSSIVFYLDVDRDPGTGFPGLTSDSATDTTAIGSELLVVMGSECSGSTAGIIRHEGPQYDSNGIPDGTFFGVGSVPVSFVEDGMDVTIPLSLLSMTDGRFNYKATASYQLIGPPDCLYTELLDALPDVGSPAAEVR